MSQHELDEMLGELSPAEEALPENRIRVVAASFQRELGQPLVVPPTSEQRPEIADWLRDGISNGRLRGLRPAVTRKALAVYPTWVDKATTLQRRSCDVCSIWAGPGMPVSFDVPIEPFSAQCSSDDLRFFKREISSYLSANSLTAQGWRDQAVCITIVAVMSRTKRLKDVDNLVKGFVDALQNVLFADDRVIQHLDVLRLRPQIPIGCYLVTARPVRSLESDIMDQTREVAWRRRIPAQASAQSEHKRNDGSHGGPGSLVGA